MNQPSLLKTIVGLIILSVISIGGFTLLRHIQTSPQLIHNQSAQALPSFDPDHDPSLVGHWTMDEGNGTTAGDSSGKGNMGTFVGSPGWTSGKIAGALSFNGTDSYLNTNGNIITGDTFTVSEWVYPTAYTSNGGGIFEEGQGGGSMGQVHITVNSGGTLSFRVTNSGLANVGSVPLNQWSHIVAVGNNKTLALYVNGVQVASGSTANTPMLNPIYKVHLGYWYNAADPTRFFNGSIDDVRVFSRALQLSEIQNLYCVGVPSGSGCSQTPINQPPLVSAGLNQTITLPNNSVMLAGTASDPDSGPQPLVTSWSIVSGGSATFTNVSSLSTQVSFSFAGTYILRLTASDGPLQTTSDVTVTVNSIAPPNPPGDSTSHAVKRDGSGDFTTIQACANQVKAGDTCLIYPGTYNEFITFPIGHSGSADSKIIFKSQSRRAAMVQGFNTTNADYIRIEGFDVSQKGIWIRSNHVEVVDNYLHDVRGNPAIYVPGITINNFVTKNPPPPTDILIDGNKLYKNNAGIYIFGYRWLVQNNDVERLYRDPLGVDPTTGFDADYMRAFGEDITVKNNYMHGTTKFEASAVARKSGTAASCSVYQDCRNVGFAPDVECLTQDNLCHIVSHTDGFQTYDNNGNWLRHAVIEGNTYEGGYWDGQPIFVSVDTHASSSPFDYDITIRNNIINPDPGTVTRAINAYAFGGVSDVFIYNNIITNANSSAISITSGKVFNNILYNNYASYPVPSATIQGGKNIVFATRLDRHDISYKHPEMFPNDFINIDPLFIDFANKNLHVQPTSPTIDKGVDLTSTGFSSDIVSTPRPQGTAWDIGAYEYPQAIVTVPVAGLCSTTANLCLQGTLADIPDTTLSTNWNCTGVNGGTTASCSLPLIPNNPPTGGGATPSGGGSTPAGGGTTPGNTPSAGGSTPSGTESGITPLPTASSSPLLPSDTLVLPDITASLLTIPLYTANDDVKVLQLLLIKYGYLAPQYANGFYNLATRTAVRSYQTDRGNGFPLYRSFIQQKSPSLTPTVPSTTSRLPSTFRFTTTLSLGMTSTQVKNLQIFLNDRGFSVAKTGNGSMNHETTYFGPATKAALIKFQEYYTKDILTPNKLTKGTGLFGVSTRGKVNTLISSK